MDLNLTGRRVIVTGGSKGIGRAIVASFLGEGARVATCARNPTDLQAMATELGSLGELHYQPGDMAAENGPRDFVTWAAETLGGLDIVVSNVSAFAGRDYEASFRVDIAGAQQLMRTSLEHMEDHAGANLICIGSRAGNVGVPWLEAYSAMKAATVSMVKSLSLEVARRGIRANVISPGDIQFPGGSWETNERENPKLYQAILRENPLRRLGRPEEIGDVVAFVASDRASFITGANIMVDGGATKGIQF